jgi:hypothetical protein
MDQEAFKLALAKEIQAALATLSGTSFDDAPARVRAALERALNARYPSLLPLILQDALACVNHDDRTVAVDVERLSKLFLERTAVVGRCGDCAMWSDRRLLSERPDDGWCVSLHVRTDMAFGCTKFVPTKPEPPGQEDPIPATERGGSTLPSRG